MSSTLLSDLWLQALRAAYKLAYEQRLALLRGGFGAKRFDSRGLHPYSVEWGRIYAMQEAEPALSLDKCDPLTMLTEAGKDAHDQFKQEVANDAQDQVLG